MKLTLTPGMRFMLLGTFLFSIGSLLIKLAGERVPTMELLFLRGVVGIGFCWVLLRRAGIGMLGTRRWLLFARGSVGFVALFAEFYAIVHLPLADAIVILFTHPAIVALLAWVILGEKIGTKGLMAVATSLTGVVLVCRPGFIFGSSGAALDPLALAVALGGIVMTSIAILVVRTLAKTEHPAVVMFYPPMIITVVSPLFAQGWVMPTPVEWLYILGIALSMNGGQYYMTRGYAIESAARISAVTCLEIVFAAIWGASFLGEIPDAWTIGGGLLIVAGTLVLGQTADLEE
ncbi:DMT family transporter [Pseudodesulfovibrio sp. zrk46]|uniref:DMT family transporter n=1 Tax=Pseudodesulfovibrio sp. zrk46 TaxID=2725288 RepID=UPI0014494A9F|nr:DMT family transporter [Pseudodesulfovibrio sp. zrk46]QJB56242.1 DMT family transporter [Pseudodesulfovibrio sp. zrk46]